MPFGFFAAFAGVFVTPAFAGCHTQIHYRTPVFGASDIRVSPRFPTKMTLFTLPAMIVSLLLR